MKRTHPSLWLIIVVDFAAAAASNVPQGQRVPSGQVHRANLTRVQEEKRAEAETAGARHGGQARGGAARGGLAWRGTAFGRGGSPSRGQAQARGGSAWRGRGVPFGGHIPSVRPVGRIRGDVRSEAVESAVLPAAFRGGHVRRPSPRGRHELHSDLVQAQRQGTTAPKKQTTTERKDATRPPPPQESAEPVSKGKEATRLVFI